MLSQQRLVGIIAVVFGYILKFVAYSILTATVLMTFAALMSAYIIIAGPEIPFFQHLSFLLPIDARGNATLNEEDIMQAYGLLAMILFVFSVAGRWLLRIFRQTVRRILGAEGEVDADGGNRSASQNPLASLKRRLIVSSIVITVIYLVLFAVIPFARMSEGTSSLTMYLIFAVFYVIAVVSNAFYIGIDGLSDMILGRAWSRVLSG